MTLSSMLEKLQHVDLEPESRKNLIIYLRAKIQSLMARGSVVSIDEENDICCEVAKLERIDQIINQFFYSKPQYQEIKSLSLDHGERKRLHERVMHELHRVIQHYYLESIASGVDLENISASYSAYMCEYLNLDQIIKKILHTKSDRSEKANEQLDKVKRKVVEVCDGSDISSKEEIIKSFIALSNGYTHFERLIHASESDAIFLEDGVARFQIDLDHLKKTTQLRPEHEIFVENIRKKILNLLKANNKASALEALNELTKDFNNFNDFVARNKVYREKPQSTPACICANLLFDYACKKINDPNIDVKIAIGMICFSEAEFNNLMGFVDEVMPQDFNADENHAMTALTAKEYARLLQGEVNYITCARHIHDQANQIKEKKLAKSRSGIRETITSQYEMVKQRLKKSGIKMGLSEKEEIKVPLSVALKGREKSHFFRNYFLLMTGLLLGCFLLALCVVYGGGLNALTFSAVSSVADVALKLLALGKFGATLMISGVLFAVTGLIATGATFLYQFFHKTHSCNQEGFDHCEKIEGSSHVEMRQRLLNGHGVRVLPEIKEDEMPLLRIEVKPTPVKVDYDMIQSRRPKVI